MKNDILLSEGTTLANYIQPITSNLLYNLHYLFSILIEIFPFRRKARFFHLIDANITAATKICK